MIFSLDPPGARMFAVRLMQIILGFLVMVLSAILSCNYDGSVLYSVAGGVMGVIFLIGGIGMFAFKRPRDVHWHLILTLDWIALLLLVYCMAVSLPDVLTTLADWHIDEVFISGGTVTDGETQIFTLFASFVAYQISTTDIAMIITSTVVSWLLFIATLYSIVRTLYLKNRGKLPPPASRQQLGEVVHLDEQPPEELPPYNT